LIRFVAWYTGACQYPGERHFFALLDDIAISLFDIIDYVITLHPCGTAKGFKSAF